jgi:hypothetical protein
MRATLVKWLLLVVTLFAISACEVTEEKIELWKGTQNGPKKLASAVIDKELSINLRAKAIVALVEIGEWKLFRESLKKMDKADSETVVTEVAPILGKMVEGGASPGGKTISKLQVDAKDALYILLDYAGGEGKANAERALIAWCSVDYNTRAMAGQYNIKAIVKKIGAPAADAMIVLLSVKEVVIKYVADLIRSVGDKEVLKKASVHLSQELAINISLIQKVHLVSAAVIGGEHIGGTLLDLATNNDVTADLQRFALRAFSEGVNTKSIIINNKHIEKLFSMAENTDYDQYQREETYYVISQATDTVAVLPRLRKLLVDKDSFWRAVGLRCILRIDGAKQLKGAISDLGKATKDNDDVKEIVARVAAFPKLLPEVRNILDGASAFSRGIAVQVLGKIGAVEDIDRLAKLTGNKTRLPKSFEHKTLGEAAAAAQATLKKKRGK